MRQGNGNIFCCDCDSFILVNGDRVTEGSKGQDAKRMGVKIVLVGQATQGT